ncbi:MAG: hypothetical protein ACOYOS_00175 [Syntrophales bacterium]
MPVSSLITLVKGATEHVTPIVSTDEGTDSSYTTATGMGSIVDIGASSVTIRGFCYFEGTSGDPTTADSTVHEDGSFSTGAYTLQITGLTPTTWYRVRAYAINSNGIGYGDTLSVPTLAFAAPALLASRILLDSTRASLSASDDASVVDHVKTTPVILATAVGSTTTDSDGSSYKLQWRVSGTGSYVDVSDTGEVKWSVTSAVLADDAILTAAHRGCTIAPMIASWVTTGTLITWRQNTAGCGTATAALAIGGVTSVAIGSCEKWSGTAWATTGAMIVARYALGGCGTTTSALNLAGVDGSYAAVTLVEKFSGASWATTSPLNLLRSYTVAIGDTASAYIWGGNSNNTTEKWSGSAWATTTPVYSSCNFGMAGCGTTSSTLMCGGWNNSTGMSNTTNIWSGTAWATTSVLPFAVTGCRSSGSTSTAIEMGGGTGALLTECNRWSGTAWSTHVPMVIAREYFCAVGASNATDSFAFGGVGYGVDTEKYTGTPYAYEEGYESLGDNIAPSTGTLDVTVACVSEIQWGLNLSDAITGTTYQFQLYNQTISSPVGVCGSTITVIAGTSWSFIMIVG